jgi:hypothetical protein
MAAEAAACDVILAGRPLSATRPIRLGRSLALPESRKVIHGAMEVLR